MRGGIPLISPQALWRTKRQLCVYLYLCLITSFSATRLPFRSRDSVVSINTRLRVGHLKFDSQQWQNVIFLKHPDQLCSPPSPLFVGYRDPFPAYKAANTSGWPLTFTAKVKNERSNTSIHPIFLHGMQSDNFAFSYLLPLPFQVHIIQWIRMQNGRRSYPPSVPSTVSLPERNALYTIRNVDFRGLCCDKQSNPQNTVSCPPWTLVTSAIPFGGRDPLGTSSSANTAESKTLWYGGCMRCTTCEVNLV
jgi:hypothetical protein